MASQFQIAQAGQLLRSGYIIAYPTEGVFGLGCRPDRPDSIKQLLRIKQRDSRAGLILIAADFDQLKDWIDPSEQETHRLLQVSEKPVTWIVRAGPRAGDLLTGGRSTLAVRITEHPVAKALCQRAGSPLVSTSANPSGRRPARRPLALRLSLGHGTVFLLNGPLGNLAGPTEIREAESGRVLRRGSEGTPQSN